MQKNFDDKALEANSDIELFHNFGVSLDTRTIYFGSLEYKHDSSDENGIDWKVAERTIKNLHILSKISKEKINIIMHSSGGDLSASFAIYDMMKMIPNKIIVTAFGSCMSGATIVMQGASQRQMTKSTRMMIHDGYTSFEGKDNDFETYGKESKALKDMMHELYLSRMNPEKKMTKKLLDDKLKHDWYLSAKEALDYGFIDKII